MTQPLDWPNPLAGTGAWCLGIGSGAGACGTRACATWGHSIWRSASTRRENQNGGSRLSWWVSGLTTLFLLSFFLFSAKQTVWTLFLAVLSGSEVSWWHRCPFWVSLVANRWRWFGCGLFPLPGPCTYQKDTSAVFGWFSGSFH